MKQLFKNLDINNFDSSAIDESLNKDNEKSDVSLTFIWTPKRHLLFYMLHLKTTSQTVNLIPGDSINSSSGNHTFFIGNFNNDEEIEISYGILAIVAVPKMISIISQTNPIKAFQVSPKNPGATNKIDSGDKFEETIKYKVI